jgi:RNA polymerase sigma-70 factor (ECF subfamily)
LYYRVGDRDEAEDLAQEVFVRAFRAIGGFKGEASFGTWIYRIVHNVAASYFVARGAKKRPGKGVPLETCAEAETAPARDADPQAALMSRELKEAIEHSIAELTPDARQYVVLRDIEGKSYEEIAAIVDLPLGTVKSRIHRARLQIRRSLESYL